MSIDARCPPDLFAAEPRRTVMKGFPPAAADRWSPTNWQSAPVNRWSFRHLREIVPTARVSRGHLDPTPLAVGAQLNQDLLVPLPGGGLSTLAGILADTETDGFLVLHDGVVVTEQYFAGHTPDTTHMLMSVSKSIVATVAAALIDAGQLDPAAPVVTYVPELAGGYTDARVQDVLDMRTGVRFSESYLDPRAEVRLLEQVIGWTTRTQPDLPDSMYEFLTTLVADRPHGGPFDYRSGETDVLGWICERAGGTRMPTLLSQHIWSRIGADHDLDAAVDHAGAVFHDGGLAATLRDTGRFGHLLLDGTVGDQQVLSGSWLHESSHPDEQLRDAFRASGNNDWLPTGAYHNHFWVPDTRRDALLCLGIHGQLIWVDRPTRTVIVKHSSWPLPQDLRRLTATFAAVRTIIARFADAPDAPDAPSQRRRWRGFRRRRS